MGQTGRLKLKRLGSLKIYFVLEDRVDEKGDGVKSGSIVIFRRNASRPSVYETIYDAWRSRLEIVARYGPDGRPSGEIAELAESRERLRAADFDLREDDGGAAGGRLTRRIGRVALDLKRKSNPLKSEARRKAQAGPVRTSRNRKVNRMATRSRVAAIDDRLARREEEVYSILPWMRAMEMALHLEADRSLGIIERLSRDAAMVFGHEFFRTGRTTANQLKGIAARLRMMGGGLRSFEAAPFRKAGRYLEQCLDKAIGRVERGSQRWAYYWLDQILTVCDRLRLQRSVEELIASVTLAPAGGLNAGKLARLARLSESLVDRCSDQPQARSFYDVALDLQAARQGLDGCRLLWRGKQAAEAAGRLSEVKETLKKVSRRLSR